MSAQSVLVYSQQHRGPALGGEGSGAERDRRRADWFPAVLSEIIFQLAERTAGTPLRSLDSVELGGVGKLHTWPCECHEVQNPGKCFDQDDKGWGVGSAADVGHAIENGRGGCYLRLTPGQYRALRGGNNVKAGFSQRGEF